MKGVTRRILAPIIICHAVGLLAILFSLIIWGDKTILAEFAWKWIFDSLIVTWIDYFIPLTVTGIVLGFSVFLNSGELRTLMQGEHSFVRLAGKSVVMVLVISVVFITLTAFVYGGSRQERDALAGHSRRAHDFLVEAQNLAKQGQNIEALKAVKSALLISPDYLAAADLENRLAGGKKSDGVELAAEGTDGEGHKAKDPAGHEGPSGQAISLPNQTERLKYADLLKTAREFLDKGDNFSALYFIRKAEEATSRDDPALVDLKTEAEKNIRGMVRSKGDELKQDLHEIKQKAIIDYLENNQPIEAYYMLLEAEEKAAGETAGKAAGPAVEGKREYRDADVRRWMPEVLARLENNTFFADEAESQGAKETGSSLLFLNSDEKGVREYVYAQAIMKGRFNLFLQSPEIIVLDRAGKVVSHRQSAYGKVVGNNLIMKSINRNKRGEVREVMVLEGAVVPEMRNVLRLGQKPETMWNLTQSRFGYQNMSFPELVGLLPLVGKAGFDALPLHAVLLGHLLQALSLPSLCFFAMGWGWSNRNRYLTRPIPLVALMIVAVPVLAVILLKIYQFLGSCLNSSLLILSGFETAIAVMLVVQTVQLAISLIYVAGQSVD